MAEEQKGHDFAHHEARKERREQAKTRKFKAAQLAESEMQRGVARFYASRGNRSAKAALAKTAHDREE